MLTMVLLGIFSSREGAAEDGFGAVEAFARADDAATVGEVHDVGL